MTSTSLPALSVSGLMVVALTSLSLPLAARAQAPCAQWSPRSLREIVQGQGTHVNTNLHRGNGTAIEGTASYTVIRNQGGERVGSGVDGRVQGTLDGNHFKIDITWSDGTTGVYEGRIRPDGSIVGTTFDRAHSGASVQWRGQLACDSPPPAAKAVPIPPTPPKPLRPLSKHRVPPAPDATCASPFVWRTARPDDLVCVTTQSRDLVAEENRTAPQRWNPGGAYGAATCTASFVWREAFEGDTVCVTPQRRTAVQEENQLGPTRRVVR